MEPWRQQRVKETRRAERAGGRAWQGDWRGGTTYFLGPGWHLLPTMLELFSVSQTELGAFGEQFQVLIFFLKKNACKNVELYWQEQFFEIFSNVIIDYAIHHVKQLYHHVFPCMPFFSPNSPKYFWVFLNEKKMCQLFDLFIALFSILIFFLKLGDLNSTQ